MEVQLSFIYLFIFILFEQIEAAIHSSNVMLYSKEQEVVSRVGHKILEDGTRVRYLIKTGEIVDSLEKWQKKVKEKKEAEVVAAWENMTETAFL